MQVRSLFDEKTVARSLALTELNKQQDECLKALENYLRALPND
jgi:hypothetical protein